MEVKYLRADLAIVHGPETVEAEGFFVAREEVLVGVQSGTMVYNLLLANLIHLIPILVSNTVINLGEVNTRQELCQGINNPCIITIPRQKGTMVLIPLNKRMRSLTISLDSSNLDMAILILQNLWVRNDLSAVLHSSVENSVDIINLESDIFDCIAVLLEMTVDLSQLGLFFGAETVGLLQRAER